MSAPDRRVRLEQGLLLGLAAMLLGALFWHHAFAASRFVDGQRVFWLDDDQMISMRYAHNLVRGRGLVWNPGERVEGYSNFGWTLVMALCHLVPWVAAERRALVVELVAFGCALGTAWAMLRLHRALTGDALFSTVSRAAMIVVTFSCVDVVFWPASGFETGALALFVTWALAELAMPQPAAARLALPLSLLPLVRVDAPVLWLPLVAVAALRLRRDRRSLVVVAATALPLVASLAFRRAYYHDWFPNTYYLKVERGPDSLASGWAYVRGFFGAYTWPVAAAAAALATRARRQVALALALVALVAAYAVSVGGDLFRPYRFFAPVLPAVFVAAFVAVAALGARRLVAGAVAGALLVWVTVPRGPNWMDRIAPAGGNGDPFDQVLVAMFLRKNLPPTARVHVLAAGIVPYFVDGPAIDALGKSERHIARLPFRRGSIIGHGKHDFDYSLGLGADVVVSYRPVPTVDAYATRKTQVWPGDYVGALLSSPTFVRDYYPNRIAEAYFDAHTALYTRAGWIERPLAWAPVSLGASRPAAWRPLHR